MAVSKSYYAVRIAMRLVKAARKRMQQQTNQSSTTPTLPAVGGRPPYGLARTGHVSRSGNFVRKRVTKPNKVEKIAKIPPAGPAIVPKKFVSVPTQGTGVGGTASSAASAGGGGAGQSSSSGSSSYFSKEWFKANGPILVLNFGSICTLLGFTRQDVLELRGLSMTGSICSIGYFALSRPAFAPMAWSALFAGTNAWKIAIILDERKGRVVLSEHEEEIYEEHFMNHGLTPKQFAKLLEKAEIIDAKKDEKIIGAGQRIDRVYLVVNGQTRASVMGRRVTAASSAPGNQVALRGGDAGAWIGEMAFLEWYWNKEKAHTNKNDVTRRPTGKKKEEKKEEEEEEEEFDDDEEDAVPLSGVRLAIYTIVANTDDCELLCWRYEDLEELMHKSADLRSALTRSMTAAIVGKVVNLTVSRSIGSLPTWSTWLDDWKNSGGAKVNVASEEKQIGAEKHQTHVPVKVANKVIKEQIAGN